MVACLVGSLAGFMVEMAVVLFGRVGGEHCSGIRPWCAWCFTTGYSQIVMWRFNLVAADLPLCGATVTLSKSSLLQRLSRRCTWGSCPSWEVRRVLPTHARTQVENPRLSLWSRWQGPIASSPSWRHHHGAQKPSGRAVSASAG